MCEEATMATISDPESVVIGRRFRGPNLSGNGGYTAGLLAEQFSFDSAVEVTLREPPPLEKHLDVVRADNSARMMLANILVAEARIAEQTPAPVAVVSMAQARNGMDRYARLGFHPFPNCFTCGPAREEGDGLRIFPGPVSEGVVASVWIPHPSLTDERGAIPRPIVWAALDCPGGWSAITKERPMVLARMTARIDSAPTVGEPHIVVGVLRRHDGRKSHVATTLFDADRRVLAMTEQMWIAVDPDVFNRL
jgi:hypothetical protein